MKKEKQDFARQTIFKLVIATIILTTLILTKHFFVQKQISNQMNISNIMNEAGRQRMLSQKITKDILYIKDDSISRAFYLSDLDKSLLEMKSIHQRLQIINQEEAFVQLSREAVDVKYSKVDEHFKDFYDAATQIAKDYESQKTLESSNMKPELLTAVKRYELLFVEHMDDLVNQYDRLAKRETEQFLRNNNTFFISIIVVIAILSLFIYYPIFRNFKKLTMDIDESNDNLIKMLHLMRGYIFLVNKHGDIILSNKDAEDVIQSNKSRKKNIARDIHFLELNILENFENCSLENRLIDVETIIEDKNKELRTVLLSIVSGNYDHEKAFLVSLFDITERKNTELTLKRIAIKDELTGLYNRHFLDQIIDQEINRSERYEVPLSAFLLDLDYFKAVNDKYGHPTGDSVLKLTAEIIQNQMRMSDYSIRIGGEEFLVILPNTSLAGAFDAAEKVRKAIENTPHPVIGTFTASFGVGERIQGETYQNLYSRIDGALYQAKENGRNQSVEAKLVGGEYSGIYLRWNKNWNSNNETIDEQHRKLFYLVSRLIEESHKTFDKENTINQIDEIIKHIQEHFHDEEKILHKIGFSELSNHQKLHGQLLKRTAEIRNLVSIDRISSIKAFTIIFDEVIIGHLLNEDTKFFSFFHNET